MRRIRERKLAYKLGFFYKDEIILVRIEPGESGFGVFFSDQLVAELKQGDDGTWEETSGYLDIITVCRLGREIASHFL